MLENVRKWVLDQGYPLEMRTALAFRKGGFEVHQSEVHYDETAGKTREIDVWAIDRNYRGLTRISFVVECKSSKKPWIIFSTNQATAGMDIFSSYAVMSEPVVEALVEVTSNDPDNAVMPFDFALFSRLKWLRKDGRIGYSFRQAFSDVDNAYSALVSAMRAACGATKAKHDADFPVMRITFPLIVVDAPLVNCYLDEDNEVQVEQIDSGEVMFTAPDQGRRTTCIRIVTAERISSFVIEAKAEIEQLRAELLTKERAIWKEHYHSDPPL